MATTTPKTTQSPTPAMEPWQYLALLARCAQEAGIEVERAFKFMGAVTLAMQQGAKTLVSPTTTAPTTERPQ